jgi:hypothetical protein
VLLAAVACSVALTVSGCGSASSDDEEPGDDMVPGPAVAMPSSPAPPADDSAAEAAAAEAEAANDPLTPAVPATPAVACQKHLTVIFTIGVPGKSKFKTNGCWTPVIADGAATATFRKCSTSSFAVQNGAAPNWAYDDTNPQHSLTQEKSFIASCSNGATGDGYEYMAYRGGWRLLGATHLRAYFSELYGSTTSDIDSLWYVNGVYKNNAGLAAHNNVYPMINFGPPLASNLQKKIHDDALTICKPIADGGYYGMYNASWRESWAANDVRLIALENALDECTRK